MNYQEEKLKEFQKASNNFAQRIYYLRIGRYKNLDKAIKSFNRDWTAFKEEFHTFLDLYGDPNGPSR